MRTPVKAIRAFCIDCMGGHRSYIDDCPSGGCSLHPYRMGRDPRRVVTEAQREAGRRNAKFLGMKPRDFNHEGRDAGGAHGEG